MLGSVVVVSVRGLVPGSGDVVYVGRKCGGWMGSVLGNRFVIGQDGDRLEVIQKYKCWLWDEYRSGGGVRCLVDWLVLRVRSGGRVVLGCWCHPLACHGDVIRDLVLWLVDQEVL